MEEESTIKIIWSVIKRRINIRTLLILVVLLSVNSYAWFIYSTKVSTGVSARVRAWNVSFIAGDDEVIQELTFDLDEIYPGMPNFQDQIIVHNLGETSADLSYEITKISILGTEYEVDDLTTSEDLADMLRLNYPFTISLNSSVSHIPINSSATFTFSVVWPYETGNDELDTYWGNLAYEYKNSHPSEDSIIITVTVRAVQNND